MSKAAESPTRISAVAEDPTANDRIAFEKAGELLLKRFNNMHMVCTRLDEAIRCAQVRLYASDHIVNPDFFTGHLRVAVAVDGRLEIQPTRAIDRTYVWTVRRDDVLGLVDAGKPDATSDSPPTRRGRISKFDWDRLAAEIIRLAHVKALPADDKKLTDMLIKWCDDQGMTNIPEYDTIRKKVGVWLKPYRAGI
jgi:hypothetical protein